jgi:hypothetical protein
MPPKGMQPAAGMRGKVPLKGRADGLESNPDDRPLPKQKVAAKSGPLKQTKASGSIAEGADRGASTDCHVQ